MDNEMVADIIQFIRDEYLEDESMVITADTPLISSGIVDSFSMVSLKMYLEDKYDIKMTRRRGQHRGLRHRDAASASLVEQDSRARVGPPPAVPRLRLTVGNHPRA